MLWRTLRKPFRRCYSSCSYAFSACEAMTKSTRPAPPLTRQAQLPKRKPAGLARLITYLSVLFLSYLGLRSLPAQETAPRTVVNLEVIVVDTESKALEALERLKKGEKFSTVAAQMSIDPNAGNGGYVGEAEVASLRPELRAAVEQETGTEGAKQNPCARLCGPG